MEDAGVSRERVSKSTAASTWEGASRAAEELETKKAHTTVT